jgi:metacaspase-1
MPRGIAVNIGLNRVDPTQYNPPLQVLRGCENDARAMNAIAQAQGFEARPLLANEATHDNVTNSIAVAAQMLQPGDMFLLTYSGHGSQVPDEIHPDDEDGMDETLVLFDRNMIDDELFTLWARFRAGVRILFISDSCHSGTVAQIAAVDEGFFHTEPALLDEDGKPRLLKSVSSAAQQRHYARFRGMYNAIRAALPDRSQVVVRASVIQLGACQDHQKAADGIRNSFFTSKLLGVWANGAFGGDYIQFFNAILSGMPTQQQPNFFRAGAQSVAFEGQRPFTI